MTGTGTAKHSRSGRHVRRSVVAALGAATMAVMFAAPAAAGQPNPPACLGEDVRAYAQGGSLFGAFVSTMLADDGAGTEVQAHLAGEVPDTSCQ
jgi:hypothetical protein